MATTNNELGVRLLRAADALGVRYCLLHNADDLLTDDLVSDIDTAVARDPWAVVLDLLKYFSGTDLHLVMLWEYDYGALTSFWCTDSGIDGVQLDLLCDPTGRGRYGLRTEAALKLSSTADPSWPPRIPPDASLVYQLSKRIVKGDKMRADQVSRLLAGIGTPDALIGRLLARRRADDCRTYNRSGRLPRRPATMRWRRRVARHGLERLVRPAGHALRVSASSKLEAAELMAPFGRFLARTSTLDGRRWWFSRVVAAVLKRRAILVLLYGSHVRVDAATSHDVVLSMERITLERLQARLLRSSK